jgi:hypothetical protein
MDKVQKYNSFNTNTPSSESYRNYLWKRIQVTLVQFSPRLMGEETTEKSRVSEWHKWFKESSHVKITNENNAQCFLKGTVLFGFIQGQRVNQDYLVEILKQLHEAVYRRPEL